MRPTPYVLRLLELGDRLVVAVEGDPFRREAGAEGGAEFAAGAHVQSLSPRESTSSKIATQQKALPA